MNNIKIEKVTDGLFRAVCGKRKALISLSQLEISLGIVPTRSHAAQALNDTSRPGDKIIVA
jgi:hypothetical protein